MKLISIFAFLLFITNARAASLDQMLDEQVHTTISPVMFKGMNVSSTYQGASNICSMLGFKRLVSITKKNIAVDPSDKLVTVEDSTIFEVNEVESCGDVSVYDAITCAK